MNLKPAVLFLHTGKFILTAIIIAFTISACQRDDQSAYPPPQYPGVSDEFRSSVDAYPPPGISDTTGSYPYPSPNESGSFNPYPYPGPGDQILPTRTLSPYQFAVSDPGFTTIHGVLFITDISLVQPDPDDAIFLVHLPEQEVSTIPSISFDQDYQADVDERTGEFVFSNIQSGTYAVVVLLKGGSELPAFTMEGGKFVIVKVTENDKDKTLELDYIRIP